MADSKGGGSGGGGAYGTASSDTSFRKTWDREEYAAKAAAREAREREEGKARYEAKMAGKKYVAHRDTPADVKDTTSRSARLDVAAQVGKTSLVPAGASSGGGKRGRSAGFYCADCDLTFKDNLQLVDHLNSKQHLMAIGESGDVQRATVDEVRARLAYLKKRREDELREADRTDLEHRLEARQDEDEKKREEKRRKRREKRRRTEGGIGHDIDHAGADSGIIC